MSALSDATAKIPLPTFLKALTSNGVPASKAMAAAGKIYKKYNTRAALSFLTDFDLKSAGVSEKEDRKLVLAALKKAGYKGSAVAGPSKSASSQASGSGAATNKTNSDAETRQGVRKKRRRDDDLNEFLPDRPTDEGDTYASLDFNEILNEEVLMPKSVVINRAPIMAAWAFVVAERLGFQREEALSIASVYTEMNAISKGVSLGIYDERKQKGVEATKGGSQPYVDLMGRRVPLFQTSSQQWRALSSGTPVAPATAFSYIKRSLRQTTPHIVGALRLLALSYPATMLNERGFSLYAEFRPEVDGWGKRGEIKCKSILALRRPELEPSNGKDSSPVTAKSTNDIVKVGELHGDKIEDGAAVEEPDRKKARLEESGDEYDAALDADEFNFDDIDLQELP
ncbi:unnamed protein product [Somion occarium]|uniref:Uncharacterized protein n=1 Tax=Somion occarium TaxID=3059160 RepID=A0ABP1CYN4_9APHY